MTEFPFGESGELEFRTREEQGRLTYLQLYSTASAPAQYMELRVFGGNLQVFVSAGKSRLFQGV